MTLPNKLKFWKIEATGNDFIFIDNRDNILNGDRRQFFKKICKRRLSVGADGIILIEESKIANYKIRYFNSDGNEATMCGNAGRASVFFAYYNGITGRIQKVEAADGLHDGSVYKDGVEFEIIVKDTPQKVEIKGDYTPGFEGFKIDTGVPHVVIFKEGIDNIDIVETGKKIRYDNIFKPEGTNVNFAEIKKDGKIKVRVYERGVEDETLSCGTGSAAVAVVSNIFKSTKYPVTLRFPGGDIKISKKRDKLFIFGKVNLVYKGTLFLKNDWR